MGLSRRGLFGGGLKVGGCGVLSWVLGRFCRTGGAETEDGGQRFIMHPIGRVQREAEAVQLRIFKPYRDALLGVDTFSHILVFYWFDRNDTPQKRRILRVHPRGNRKNPLTGVFACRAPVRPNLIALTRCKVLRVADGIVHIDKIDALDGSPILDIKPYIPGLDGTPKDIRTPKWLGR